MFGSQELQNGHKAFKNSHGSERKAGEVAKAVRPGNFVSNAKFNELNFEDPRGAYEGEYVQPRWEDVKGSAFTDHGSASSSHNDLGLVLLSKEQKNGLMIKKFREFKRTDAEADNKSVSNRSVTSESSRINLVQFHAFRLANGPAEPSEISVLKEVHRPADDIKSETLSQERAHRDNDDSKALTEHLGPNSLPATALANQSEVQSLAEVHLAEDRQPEEQRQEVLAHAKEAVTDLQIPVLGEVKASREITNPAEASKMLQGEIAEVILEVDRNGRFEGELVDGKMSGYGRLFDDHGRLVFEGDFVDDQFQGLGVLYNHKSGSQPELNETAALKRHEINLGFVKRGWDRYEGLFHGGRFHGRGYLYFGSKFVLFSRFKDGEIESGCCLRDTSTGEVERLDIYGSELIRRSN